jgi:hypothetical protein
MRRLRDAATIVTMMGPTSVPRLEEVREAVRHQGRHPTVGPEDPRASRRPGSSRRYRRWIRAWSLCMDIGYATLAQRGRRAMATRRQPAPADSHQGSHRFGTAKDEISGPAETASPIRALPRAPEDQLRGTWISVRDRTRIRCHPALRVSFSVHARRDRRHGMRERSFPRTQKNPYLSQPTFRRRRRATGFHCTGSL